MLDETLKEHPTHLPIRLDNETCVYCGAVLDDISRSKEHVIARNFVPKGKLNQQWNLIVLACKTCNGLKADLENDISAISMQPSVFGAFAESDQTLESEARRKAANAISRRTGKPIKDSAEHLVIKWVLAPGIEFTFDMHGPPQADSERIFALARMQVMAFFYFITFNPATKRGQCWRGVFYPVMEVMRGDWGNPVLRDFMKAVVEWEPRVLAVGADTFFKIVIRKHPSADCWSWALEWNRQYRIIGFCGNQLAAEAVVRTFTQLETHTVAQGPNEFVRYRLDVPLADDDDLLFHWEQKAASAPPGDSVT
jgi:hypothetical protein